MKNNKLSKGQLVAIVAVIVVMVIAIAVGGILIYQNFNGNVSETSSTETTESQAEDTTDTVATVDTTDEVEKATSQDTTEQEGKETTSKNNNSNNISDTQSNTTSTKSHKEEVIEEVKIEDADKEAKGKNVLKVNGVKCDIGDTITVVLNLKTPETLINFQGTTYFDSEYLECVSTTMNVSGMINAKTDSILYNGSEISKGFNFTGYGTMYVAEFKVLKKGNTTITNDFEVLSNMDMKLIDEKDCVVDLVIYN